MFGLSLSHLLIVLLVVLLFGAKRIPELGSSLGRGLRAFKKGLEGRDEHGLPFEEQPKIVTETSVVVREASDVSGEEPKKKPNS